MDFLHRAFSGQSLSRRELQIVGWFLSAWFLMDVVQFADLQYGTL